MPVENLVSFTIPQEQLLIAQQKIKDIQDIFAPYIKGLTPSEVKSIFKMNDKSIPFVEKCFEYSKNNTQYVPPFINIDDLEIDFNSAKDISSVIRPLSQLIKSMQDTMILCGGEAMAASLAIYNSIKQAAKMNEPCAKTIYEDLKKRFELSSKTAEEPSTN